MRTGFPSVDCVDSNKKTFPRAGFEPATYGCLMVTTTVHRSTN